MRSRLTSLAACSLLALVAAACGGEGAASDDPVTGVDASIDAPGEPTGPGCGARSPRTVALEAFVAPSGLQSRITSFIDGAQDSLDVQMYLFTVDAIASRIIAAKNRGVAVRVLLDPDHVANDDVRADLTAANVPLRDATTLYTFSHAKYLIADGARAIVMSANFNYDAMSMERNYGVVDRDPDDLADLQAIFDMDWASAGGTTPTPADLACTRLIVSPNNALQRILEHINGAQQTLDLELQYLSETTVREAVGAAKQRGVAVRVMLSDRTDEAVPYLTGLGIPVRFPSGFRLHAKLIIADGVPLIGSINMSLTSLTRNREVGVLLTDPTPAQAITAQFQTDWAAGSP